jgi:CDP-glucose 4,6-dehydratase
MTALPNATFWSGRRVLVTGHTGFKGSWLSLWLHSLGAEVTGYALAAPTTPSLFEQARIAQCIRSVTGDVRDPKHLSEVVRATEPEVILHLAAQSLVRKSYEEPFETYATNVMGTAAVLEAARAANSVRAVVIVSSDKCYENHEWEWRYRENDRLGGHDPYSNSKACAELVTHAYRRSFFDPQRYAEHRVAVASARAGNVIGGGDWSTDRIVPDTVRAFLAGRPVSLRNPSSVRPWQHVLEPLGGYLLLAERLVQDGPAFAEEWNFGPPEEQEQPVRALAEHLRASWGDGATIELAEQAPDAPREAVLLRLDASKARRRLGWRCLLPLRDTIDWIVAWHRGVGRGGDAREATERQIAEYAAHRG